MSRVGEVTHRGSGVCFQVSLSNTGLMSAWLMFSYLLLKKKKTAVIAVCSIPWRNSHQFYGSVYIMTFKN